MPPHTRLRGPSSGISKRPSLFFKMTNRDTRLSTTASKGKEARPHVLVQLDDFIVLNQNWNFVEVHVVQQLLEKTSELWWWKNDISGSLANVLCVKLSSKIFTSISLSSTSPVWASCQSSVEERSRSGQHILNMIDVTRQRGFLDDLDQPVVEHCLEIFRPRIFSISKSTKPHIVTSLPLVANLCDKMCLCTLNEVTFGTSSSCFYLVTSRTVSRMIAAVWTLLASPSSLSTTLKMTFRSCTMKFEQNDAFFFEKM